MSRIFVTYSLSRTEGARTGLSILLDDSFGRDHHEWIAELHDAAYGWGADNGAAGLTSDVGDIPEGVDAQVTPLVSYLYSGGVVNGARLVRHLESLRSTGAIPRITPRPGNPVSGVALLGREDVIRQMTGILQTGSCHLRGPRRYGKTSVLRETERRLEAAGVPTVMVDLSPGDSARWFVLALAIRAMDQEGVRPAIEGLNELVGWPAPGADPGERSAARDVLARQVTGNYLPFTRRLLESMAAAGVVLVLDEFSVFLRAAIQEDPANVKALLEMLREARHFEKPLRMAVAGSTGLSAFVEFYKLAKSLDDFERVDLPPLPEDLGRILSEELLYGMDLLPSPEVLDRIRELVGEPVPYFLHALADAIQEETTSGSHPDPEVVEDAYRERVVGPLGSYLFKAYRLTAHPYPPELRGAAARLLRALAVAEDGVPEPDLADVFKRYSPEHRKDQFRALMACLEEDYDLVQGEAGWRMRCKVLRDRFRLSAPWIGAEV